MCVPLAAVAIAATVVGTAASAYSAYQQVQSQNQANEFNAKVAERNAENANIQANQVVQQGQVEEAQHRLAVKNFIGTQRAAQAGNGLIVDDGTGLDLTKDTAGFGELDAITIRSNAARNAWAVRNDAANSTAEASLARSRNTSPVLPVGSSLLSGVSQLATQYRQLYK